MISTSGKIGYSNDKMTLTSGKRSYSNYKMTCPIEWQFKEIILFDRKYNCNTILVSLVINFLRL